MLLSELQAQESGIILKVRGQGAFRKRVTEMGFIKGQPVTVIRNAPLQDPVEYSVMGYNVSLRRSEASLIEVEPGKKPSGEHVYAQTLESDPPFSNSPEPGKTINIALIGNPNCGKTSIFNQASRSYEHVGNYGGVTVETKVARVEYQGYTFNIYDLPGTYSLTSYSPEEIYVRNFLTESLPDVVVNVVDATNLERNLYLTTQLIDMNVKMVMALNMFDELKASGNHFDHISFSSMLGIPVIPTVGSKGKGIAILFMAIIGKFRENDVNRKRVQISYGPDIEDSVNKILQTLSKECNIPLTRRVNSRFISLKLLEGDEHMQHRISDLPNTGEISTIVETERRILRELMYDEPETLISDARFGFISGALRETFHSSHDTRRNYSEKIDNVLTNKYLGIPIFFLFLWIMFSVTFKLGQYPMNWIEQGMNGISSLVPRVIPAGDLQDLLMNGIIGGVGGVLVFLPNILILFFFISFLEDTGYMARAAFIMDKFMHHIGLHGKSFIPMVMGFGCNVPAIMSTRIIESRNNRLLTMLLVPFMSCSARLPVYILVISTFFPSHQGTVLFGIYLAGILLAVFSALLFRRLFFRKGDSPFVMELPPYRMPTLRNTSRHMWNKGSQYLRKIGGIILVASILIWGLGYYPKNSLLFNHKAVSLQEASFVDPGSLHKAGEHTSFLEDIGKMVQPVMRPLGFDWKMTISLMAGVAGKEVVVSTIGVIYNNPPGETRDLGKRMKQQVYTQGPMAGQMVYSPRATLAFLVFILVYFPCIAVVATVARESGSLWWAVFMIIYTTGMAWLLSLLTYQTGSLFV